MVEPGQIVEGRYTVEASIATGGMAEVYRVRHNQLGSAHALKVLVLRTRDIKRRLLQEGRVQAALHHPNAIAVTDVVDVDGHPGLIMEYVDGPTIGDWVHLDSVDYAQVERVFREVVAAVGEAHRVGLIHRDIKPSNVLMARAGDERIAKVIDFGLAKVIKDIESEDDTRSGVPMGTPSYMAPEQITDAKSVDSRADIWSLGALLYYLVCKKKAFQATNAVQTYNAVLNGSFPPPQTLVPDIPDALVRTIEACLQVHVDSRPASCEALLRILDGDPTAEPLAEPVDRRFLYALAGGTVLAAFVVAAALVVQMQGTATPAPGPVVVPGTAPDLPDLHAVQLGTSDQLPAATPATGQPARPAPRGKGARPQPQAAATTACRPTDAATRWWVQVGPRAKKLKVGDTWTLEGPSSAFKRHPETVGQVPGSPVCSLPAGTDVHVHAEPVKVKGEQGFWLPVVGDGFSLP